MQSKYVCINFEQISCSEPKRNNALFLLETIILKHKMHRFTDEYLEIRKIGWSDFANKTKFLRDRELKTRNYRIFMNANFVSTNHLSTIII